MEGRDLEEGRRGVFAYSSSPLLSFFLRCSTRAACDERDGGNETERRPGIATKTPVALAWLPSLVFLPGIHHIVRAMANEHTGMEGTRMKQVVLETISRARIWTNGREG